VEDPAPLEPGEVLGGLVEHEDGDGRPRRWGGSGVRKRDGEGEGDGPGRALRSAFSSPVILGARG